MGEVGEEKKILYVLKVGEEKERGNVCYFVFIRDSIVNIGLFFLVL